MDTSDVNIKSSINRLRELVSKEENLFIGKSDRMYYRYLYISDFNPESALEKIKYRYKLKAENPEWFCSLPLSKYDDLLKRRIKILLDKRDNRGLNVYIIKASRVDVDLQPVHELAQTDDLWMDPHYDEPETLKNGVACIIDFKDTPWNIVKYLTPHNLRVGVDKTESTPVKHLEFHVIGGGFLVNTLISLTFPWLKQETKDKIHLHTSVSSLHKYINKDILPIEYGGKEELEPESFYKCIETNKDILLEMVTYGYKQ